MTPPRLKPAAPRSQIKHSTTDSLRSLTDLGMQSDICKGPKYRVSSPIDFNKCRDEIVGAL